MTLITRYTDHSVHHEALIRRKDKQKLFFNVISKQAIKRHLIASLAEILSPTVAARYSDKEVCVIAAGSSEVVQMREHLQSKKKILETGQEDFCNAVG